MNEKQLREIQTENRATALATDEELSTAPSINKNPMDWVNFLREVGDPILRKRADVGRLIDRATDLENMAKDLRAQAYRAALALESDCRKNWTDEEITEAKKKAEK